MRFGLISRLLAVVAVQFAAPAALAQDSTVLGGLRGALPPVSVAAATPSANPTTTPAASDATTADSTAADTTASTTAPADSRTAVTAPDEESVTGSIRRRPEEDPYQQLGIRRGSLIYYPAVNVEGGYSTNASGTAGGAGSGFVTITPELIVRSDWSRHAFSATLRGSYKTYTDGTTADEPTASLDVTGRIDLPNLWTVDLAGGYSFQHQSASDPNFPSGVDSPPGVHDITGSATLNGGSGRFVFALGASVERTAYDNGTSGGLVVDQGDRTDTLYGARLRLGYRATGMLTPFVEAETSRRAYDQTLDDNGLARSSTGWGLRTGIVLDAEPVVKAESSIGFKTVNFDDPALTTLTALTVDTALTWSVTPLTTVTLNTTTGISPTTDMASSGSIYRDISLDLAYAYRRNVTIDWLGTYRRERFEGTGTVEQTFSLGANVVWRLNRFVQVTSGYAHEWLLSSDTASDYSSDTLRVGMRFQR